MKLRVSSPENVKSKDELTFDVKLNQMSGASVLTKQYRNKAKSDGQDILSPLVEQLAQLIIETAKI